MQKNVFVGNLAKAVVVSGNGDRAVARFTLILKGDQLIVDYRIENNNFQKDGEDVYGYNFVVEDFTFGAPGKEKREQFRAGQ